MRTAFRGDNIHNEDRHSLRGEWMKENKDLTTHFEGQKCWYLPGVAVPWNFKVVLSPDIQNWIARVHMVFDVFVDFSSAEKTRWYLVMYAVLFN